MGITTHSSDTVYMRCHTYAILPKQRLCTPHNINYQKLENAVVKEIQNICQQYLDKKKMKQIIDTEYEDNWIIGDSLSIGGAIEHICLRATDLELGSLWIRDIVYTQKEIAKLVGYENTELISAISIGYPDESPKQRPRKKLNEVLEWY